MPHSIVENLIGRTAFSCVFHRERSERPRECPSKVLYNRANTRLLFLLIRDANRSFYLFGFRSFPFNRGKGKTEGAEPKQIERLTSRVETGVRHVHSLFFSFIGHYKKQRTCRTPVSTREVDSTTCLSGFAAISLSLQSLSGKDKEEILSRKEATTADMFIG